MSNHPNRTRPADWPSSPSKDDIRAAREAIPGLSQTDAAALIYRKLRTWQDWESGDRRMPPDSWELWRIKAEQLTPARG